jgi:hypothetical protein
MRGKAKREGKRRRKGTTKGWHALQIASHSIYDTGVLTEYV